MVCSQSDLQRQAGHCSAARNTLQPANAVVDEMRNALVNYKLPKDVQFKFSGEIEEQEKNMDFLSNALLSALGLILFLLVFQFNSISKPIIILISIFLSFTGVFFGITLFQIPLNYVFVFYRLVFYFLRL